MNATARTRWLFRRMHELCRRNCPGCHAADQVNLVTPSDDPGRTQWLLFDVVSGRDFSDGCYKKFVLD